MFKLKLSAVITILIGIVSLVWTVYDYIALTNAVYNYGQNLIDWWRIVSYGFIPVVLFHISAFVTIYFLFGYLKQQKKILKESKQLKAESGSSEDDTKNP